LVSLIVLAGCEGTGHYYTRGGWNTTNYISNMDVESAKARKSQGTAFQQALHMEYVAMAESRRNRFDMNDTGFFLNKANASARGESLQPQRIPARNLPGDKVSELAAARAKLMPHLNPGDATTRMPKVAAKAQAMFDCWMEEQEENLSLERIAACRSAFFAALAKLGPVKMPMAAMPAPTPEPMAKPAPAPAPMAKAEPQPLSVGPFIVHFDFDSDKLSAEATQTLSKVVATAIEAKSTMVVITGHADRSGANTYNMALSKRRVMAVSSELVKAGMPGDMVDATQYGEERPAVPTPDGQKEAANRRVEIELRK